MDRAEYMREYRKRPDVKAKDRERRQRYYAENREAILARQREHYPKHRDKKRAASARWRQENPDRHRENRRRYVERHPERARESSRRSHLKQRYGITPRDVDRLLTEQDGRCAICLSPFDVAPCVDHDHATGQVRGLLCFTCNSMLGHAIDEPERLRAAAAYLEQWREYLA